MRKASDDTGRTLRRGEAARRRVRGLATFAAFAMATAAAAESAEPEAPAAAEAAASDVAHAVEPGDPATAWQRLGYGITVGYGHGFAPRGRQRGRDVANVQVITFEPGIRLSLTDAGDGSRWYHGVLEGTLEGLLMFNVTPSFGHAGGANAGLRYRFRQHDRVQPYVEGSIGLGGIGFDLASQNDGFTFFLQAGVGARLRLDERLSAVASLRWQHVSNAQTHLPNNGIDLIGFRVGVELR